MFGTSGSGRNNSPRSNFSSSFSRSVIATDAIMSRDRWPGFLEVTIERSRPDRAGDQIGEAFPHLTAEERDRFAALAESIRTPRDVRIDVAECGENRWT